MSFKIQRNKSGFTQQQVADLLGTSRVTVARWEGKISEADHKTLKKLCEIYNCTLDELLSDDEASNPPQPSLPTEAQGSERAGETAA